MKLYGNDTSPYVRKVRVVLALTGQEDAVEMVTVSGTPLAANAEIVGANPLGKVPCLVTGDGQAIYDSRVITRFLDARADGGLYPEGAALYPALTLEALADGILDAAILAVYETRLRPEELRFAPWVQGQMSKIHRAMGVLEGEAGRWPKALGPGSHAGHIGVACALGYLDLRFPDIGWRDGRPALAEWFGPVAAHPAMTATKAG